MEEPCRTSPSIVSTRPTRTSRYGTLPASNPSPDQLGDGLVALPHSARNLEHLQWLAADIAERAGTATVWHARTDSRRDHDAHVAAMRASVEADYRPVLVEADGVSGGEMSTTDRRRVVRRLRGQLRRIGLRVHFGAPAGRLAREAVDRLAGAGEALPV